MSEQDESPSKRLADAGRQMADALRVASDQAKEAIAAALRGQEKNDG